MSTFSSPSGMPSVFLVGLMFYAVAVAHHWKGYNGVSVVDFFISRYNHKVGFLAAIFLFCGTYLRYWLWRN